MSTLREEFLYIDLKIFANDSITEKDHFHKTFLRDILGWLFRKSK